MKALKHTTPVLRAKIDGIKIAEETITADEVQDRPPFNEQSRCQLLFTVVAGGDGMRPVSINVRANSPKRAMQWFLAYVRCRWLNRKNSKAIRDTRDIWIAECTLLKS